MTEEGPLEFEYLLCDCGKEILAKLIDVKSRLYEWNCSECGLQRDIDV
jgi:transcription elongation factor Elf1